MDIQKIVCKTNEEWRRERCHSIGASAIGTLIGENPYQTPYELALKMRAELNGEFDYTENLAMKRGHAYEQGVAELFEWQSGKKVIKASSREFLIRRSDLPFMHASPDRTYWIDDSGTKYGKNAEMNKGILECKTTRRPIDGDNLPLGWVFQLQVQMGISGYHDGYIAWDVLTHPDGFGYRHFVFDEEVFGAAVELCRDFWERCIERGEDPEAVNARDVVAKYPKPIEGKSLYATSSMLDLVQQLRDMKSAKRELEEAIEKYTDQLKVQFRDEEILVSPTGQLLATYKATAQRTTIDSRQLKIDYPEAYEACKKVSAPTRTFNLK